MKEMLAGGKNLGLAVACLLLGVMPLGATTYVLMSDEAIADQAVAIAEIEIVKPLEARRSQPPATEYLGIVQRVLKGELKTSTITVRTPGGRGTDGIELDIRGVPRFRAGERVLLFLDQNRKGAWEIAHWSLGAFKITEFGGRTRATRDLSEADVLSVKGQEHLLFERDYEKFSGWLEDRSRGIDRDVNYFERADIGLSTSPFTLFTFRGKNVRWFDFDPGNSVGWRFRSAGSAGTFSGFRAALEAWNRETQTPISYTYVGPTGSTAGFTRPDGSNSVIFGDPNRNLPGRFSCSTGGVLAAAGPWLSTNTTRVFESRRYHRIFEADIVVNDGADCFIRNNTRRRAEEVFGHELGHTLGIGHSCGDAASGPCDSARKNEALMRAIAHDNQLGASLRTDDKAAVRRLYRRSGTGGGGGGGGGGGDALAAPSGLIATATSQTAGTLEWTDNSSGETRFQIVRRTNRQGNFEKWIDVPRNTTSTTFTDGRPGTIFEFKMRARGGAGEAGDWSFVTFVVMPGTGGGGGVGGGGGGGGGDALAAPSNLTVRATSRNAGVLQWRDNSSAESRFQIVRRVNRAGPFEKWVDVSRNSQSTAFGDASPGATYEFKIRARGGPGEASAWSNVAVVTMPGTGGGGGGGGGGAGLAAPSNLSVSATSRTTGVLQWKDNSSDETRFQFVFRTPGAAWSKLGDAARNAQSATFSNLTPGATYEFKVRARGGPGEASAWSNVARVVMPP